jgi:predicted glycosyltransferase
MHTCTKLIVAMAGGGADAFPMMRTLIDALPAIQSRQRSLLVLITGPFMPVELQEELKLRAYGMPVRILSSVDDTHSFQEAADLVVAMAGYNTTVEILQAGKRAILIPRRGPSAEQRTRAQLFAARGWIEMLDPDDLETDAVASLVSKSLGVTRHMSAENRPDLDGVHVAAQTLLDLTPSSSGPRSLAEPMRSDSYELANHRQ